MKSTLKTDILILGAGIGGYETFRTLNKELKRAGLKRKITIVDRNNYFTFTPLLHEVASASVEPEHAAVPLRELIMHTTHDFFTADVTQINPEQKTVSTSRGEISYEYCVVALGSGVNYFGTKGAAEFSHNVRTLASAIRTRETIINQLETCASELHLSIVGGGYTGVEVASQFAYLSKHHLRALYPHVTITVHLLQNTDSLVPNLPPKAQQLVIRRLRELGVLVSLGKAVKAIEKNRVLLDDSSTVPSDITIWSAGVGNMGSDFMPAPMCTRGQIEVTEFLNSPTQSMLYAVGDIACGHNPGETLPFPPLGESAHRQGEYVARHIVASLQGKKLSPYYFKSMGTLMPIGDWYGLVIRGNFVMSGVVAWWLRRTVYLLFMPGFMRKLKLALDWTLHLFGARYIITVKK